MSEEHSLQFVDTARGQALALPDRASTKAHRSSHFLSLLWSIPLVNLAVVVMLGFVGVTTTVLWQLVPWICVALAARKLWSFWFKVFWRVHMTERTLVLDHVGTRGAFPDVNALRGPADNVPASSHTVNWVDITRVETKHYGLVVHQHQADPIEVLLEDSSQADIDELVRQIEARVREVQGSSQTLDEVHDARRAMAQLKTEADRSR